MSERDDTDRGDATRDQPQQPGYGTPPGHGAPPAYGTPQDYGTAQGYGTPPAYGSPQGYGAAPAYGAPQGYGTAPYAGQQGGYPEPSQAVLALVLGIIGLVAFQLLAPFAWYIATKEIRAVDAGRRNPKDRGLAVAGKVMGIVGTVLLGIGLLIVIILIIAVVAGTASGISYSST